MSRLHQSCRYKIDARPLFNKQPASCARHSNLRVKVGRKIRATRSSASDCRPASWHRSNTCSDAPLESHNCCTCEMAACRTSLTPPAVANQRKCHQSAGRGCCGQLAIGVGRCDVQRQIDSSFRCADAGDASVQTLAHGFGQTAERIHGRLSRR